MFKASDSVLARLMKQILVLVCPCAQFLFCVKASSHYSLFLNKDIHGVTLPSQIIHFFLEALPSTSRPLLLYKTQTKSTTTSKSHGNSWGDKNHSNVTSNMIT